VNTTFMLMILMVNTTVEVKMKMYLGVEEGMNPKQIETIVEKDGWKPGLNNDTNIGCGVKIYDFSKDNNYIIAAFYKGELIKIRLNFYPNRNSKIIVLADKLEKQLNTKYEILESYKFCDYPYEYGDGYEDTALWIGKLHFIILYKIDGGQLSLSLKPDPDIHAEVTYETYSWDKIYECFQDEENEKF